MRKSVRRRYRYLPERWPLLAFAWRRLWHPRRLTPPLVLLLIAAAVVLFISLVYLFGYLFTLIIHDDPRFLPFWNAAVCCELLLFTLYGALVTSSLISRERERGTLEILLAAVPPREMLLQQLVAGLIPPATLFGWCTGCFGLLALVSQGITLAQFVGDSLLVAIALLGGAAVGLLASCHARTAASALVWASLGVLPLLVGITLFWQTISAGQSSTALAWDNTPILVLAYLVSELILCWWAWQDSLRVLGGGWAGVSTDLRRLLPAPVRIATRSDLLPGWHPLLWFEVRRRLRGPSSFLVLGGHLLVLSTVLALMSRNLHVARPSEIPLVGRSLWGTLQLAQTLLLLLVVPGLAVTTIQGELEHGTLEGLFIAPFTSRTLLWDKLLGILGQVLLLLLSTLPLVAGIAMTYGGIAVQELLGAFSAQVLLGLLLGGLGVMASAQARTLGQAIGRAYLYMLGTVAAFPCVVPILAFYSDDTTAALLVLCLLLLGAIVVFTRLAQRQLDALRTDLDRQHAPRLVSQQAWAAYYREREISPRTRGTAPPPVSPPQGPPSRRW